ncbi:LamG domain-containing protein [Candidatus Poribacteria bacterium]|nr:LamG domain-containing protein [Candidatus Poribacteria bacterium]
MSRTKLIGCLAALGLLVAPIARGELVAMWLLDEGKGQDAKDGTGNGFDGVIEGKADWTDGKFGKGLAFSGGRANVKHSDKLSLMQWSMSVWVKIKGATGTYQMVMGKEGWPNRNYSMWVLPTIMTFGYTSGANDVQTQGGDVVDDKWHHLVGTYDQKNLTAYIDGVMTKQVPAAGKPNTCDCPFFIGSQPPGGGGPTMGSLDEAAVYSHALTEKEVLAAMSGQKTLAVRPTGKLAALWGRMKAQ